MQPKQNALNVLDDVEELHSADSDVEELESALDTTLTESQHIMDTSSSSPNTLIIPKGLICNSCTYMSGEAPRDLCGFISLACLRALFELDQDVGQLPRELQQQRVLEALREEGRFKVRFLVHLPFHTG